MDRITIRLNAELHKEIADYATRSGLAKADAARRLVERGLAGFRLDAADPSALLASLSSALTEMVESLREVRTKTIAIDANMDTLMAGNADLIEALAGLMAWTDDRSAYDRESLEMIAQLSIIGRMFVKSRFPNEFTELKAATERQMQIVEKAARDRIGRIENGVKGGKTGA